MHTHSQRHTISSNALFRNTSVICTLPTRRKFYMLQTHWIPPPDEYVPTTICICIYVRMPNNRKQTHTHTHTERGSAHPAVVCGANAPAVMFHAMRTPHTRYRTHWPNLIIKRKPTPIRHHHHHHHSCCCRTHTHTHTQTIIL